MCNAWRFEASKGFVTIRGVTVTEAMGEAAATVPLVDTEVLAGILVKLEPLLALDAAKAADGEEAAGMLDVDVEADVDVEDEEPAEAAVMAPALAAVKLPSVCGD